MYTPILSKNKLSSKLLATGPVTHVKILKKKKQKKKLGALRLQPELPESKEKALLVMCGPWSQLEAFNIEASCPSLSGLD